MWLQLPLQQFLYVFSLDVNPQDWQHSSYHPDILIMGRYGKILAQPRRGFAGFHWQRKITSGFEKDSF